MPKYCEYCGADFKEKIFSSGTKRYTCIICSKSVCSNCSLYLECDSPGHDYCISCAIDKLQERKKKLGVMRVCNKCGNNSQTGSGPYCPHCGNLLKNDKAQKPEKNVEK